MGNGREFPHDLVYEENCVCHRRAFRLSAARDGARLKDSSIASDFRPRAPRPGRDGDDGGGRKLPAELCCTLDVGSGEILALEQERFTCHIRKRIGKLAFRPCRIRSQEFARLMGLLKSYGQSLR